ncbi:MAG: hypothetical protein MZW92_42405 [Comamonadaceae bacterium]|nr:hypothetical protein [Comamonadaceae bacterium]
MGPADRPGVARAPRPAARGAVGPRAGAACRRQSSPTASTSSPRPRPTPTRTRAGPPTIPPSSPTLGMLPGAGVDRAAMARTFDWIWAHWDWPSTWGWDYPMMAMTAARLGKPDLAIDALLMDTPKNVYRANGHNHQRPGLTIYLPGNGGLLYAVAHDGRRVGRRAGRARARIPARRALAREVGRVAEGAVGRSKPVDRSQQAN